MRLVATVALVAPLYVLAACKPPPTDADMDRDTPEEELVFASDPLPSPETEGAMWAPSARTQGRLIYGKPEELALVVLDCINAESAAPTLRITRLAPADEGASALLALVGNGHIGRLPVEARAVDDGLVWQGELLAADLTWEPLTGPRAVGLTVPGAGRVELNPSARVGELVESCRAGGAPSPAP